MIGSICIIFDCYQTLVYKKNLEKTIQDFISDQFNKNESINNISKALNTLYGRRKFLHPTFSSAKDRKNYYIVYNQELFEILKLKLSDQKSRKLNYLIDTTTEYSIYDDVLETLKYFTSKGTSMGILANWTKDLEKVIKEVGISKYFDFIFSSSKSKFLKPDPRIFPDLLSDITEKYKKIYYVGDDYDLDIKSASLAGLTPILIDRKQFYTKKTNCLNIKSLISLKDIIHN